MNHTRYIKNGVMFNVIFNLPDFLMVFIFITQHTVLFGNFAFYYLNF